MESMINAQQVVPIILYNKPPPPSKTNNNIIMLKAAAAAAAASSSSSQKLIHCSTNKQPFETLNPLPSLLLLKSTCVAIAAASLFFLNFTRPSIAIAPPPVVQPTLEEKENTLEQHLLSNPQDVQALRTLMEIKLNDQKLIEAISIVDTLIQIEPSEKQWRLLRAHLHSYSGDTESAKLGFEDMLSEDPLFVEAYHGLVITLSQSESGEMEILLKRIENAIQQCSKDPNREQDLRDFRLLVAQLRFIQGSYVEALKVYQHLAKQDPTDFRPYLYQGIIYTLLRQTDQANRHFDNYKRLVPHDHPYARYFEDNVMATEAFNQIIGTSKP